MYLYTQKKGWQTISRIFAAEDIENELFHFGFIKSDLKFNNEKDEFFKIVLYENENDIIPERFLIFLSFFEIIYEILIPDLPDLITCLKELKTSLIWN